MRIGILGVVLAMLHGCADRFILFPTTHYEDAGGAVRHEIPFDGGQIEIIRARSPGALTHGPEAYVLCFIGNADRAERRAYSDAVQWNERPVEIWTVNYPGYGASTGPAKLNRFPAAALAAWDAVHARADGKRIFVKGESIGTTSALYVAANRKVDGLLLRSPVPLRKLILGHFGWWNLWLAAGAVASAVPGELDSVRNAARIDAPAVFLLTDPDELVPTSYQRMVVSAFAGPRRQIEQAADCHNGPLTPQACRELDAAIEWLWQGPRTP